MLADVLRQLRGEGLSILLVEHDMDLVMGLVDRVVVMEFGTKLIEGTPARGAGQPGGARGLSRDGALTWPSCCSNVRNLHAGYGKAEVLHGLRSRRGRQGHHRDRPERRRQVDPAQRADGRAAVEGQRRIRRQADRPAFARGARHARHGAGARDARAVRDDVGRGQPAARRLSPGAPRQQGQRQVAQRGLHAVPAPARAAQRSWPARFRAANGRCWRSAAR